MLLLLVTGDRRSRLEVGYGLEPVLPDGFAGSILRDMRPALRERRYGEALTSAAQAIAARIAAARGIALDSSELPRRASPRPAEPAPWLLLGGFAVFVFLLAAAARCSRRRAYYSRGFGGGGFLPGLILGQVLSNRHSWGGRSGGGFGGYDSGDSFGGFGGGDSGGGGASSNW